MRPSPSGYPQPPARGLLPAAASAELGRLEARLGQVADQRARAELAALGETAVTRVLASIAATGDRVRTLSGLIVFLARQEAMVLNAAGIPTAESAVCNFRPFRAEDLAPDPEDGMEVESPHGWTSPARDHTPSPVRDISRRVQLMDGPSGTPPSVTTGSALRATEAPQPRTDEPSPQMIALGELEPVRRFLIFVYLANKKLEEVLEDVNYIMHLKSLPMDHFESEIWNKFGHESLPTSERRKNLDCDPSKTRLFHCNVEKRHHSTVIIFKGPYIDNTRTHLQKVVGDDNVLIVKFADIPEIENSANKFAMYCTYYSQIAEDVYKEGGKEDRQKEEQKKAKNKKCSPSVRCYFVRAESGWGSDVPYILSGCTIGEARGRFMHIHTAPTVSKYLARLALILSKTITYGVTLSEINVITIEDEPCKDEQGNISKDDDGEALIHTDGTGRISFDLAIKCPVNVFKGNFLKGHELQETLDPEKHRYLVSYPLLIQFRMFYNGNAVKGTLLADKTLPEKTIHIRPSMIKINADPNSSGGPPFNSLEVVTVSNRPRRSYTSRILIALLLCGGVPAEYFVELLGKALEDANKTRTKAGDSLEVALNHAAMDDLISARMILAGIQPEVEAFLQYQLDIMTKEERKGFQQGKIPIDDCCTLMGTTDPTGTLKPDQVCVIHDNRQISGKVLVYKHPGLHFGDIHKLTATHIDGLEETVGNSKYTIFFPTSGSRSLADEMANSDFDGDMYWVSWNPQLLKYFEPGKPWEHKSQPKNTKQKKPQDYDGPELERLLFCEFLRARFSPSYVLGRASNCWLTRMDRLLTHGVPQSEKNTLKNHMLELVDIYYWALDAPKNGTEIKIPQHLMVGKYPHFLEREPSYNSTSLLGWIYDKAKSQQSESTLPIKKLVFNFMEEAVSEDCKRRWISLYHHKYLKESSLLCKLEDKEERNIKFRELFQGWRRIYYEAETLEASPRSRLDLFSDACAIYQVVYEHAMPRNEVSKCAFVWKVAGRVLCELYLLKHGGETVTCLRSVLEDAFKKYRA